MKILLLLLIPILSMSQTFRKIDKQNGFYFTNFGRPISSFNDMILISSDGQFGKYDRKKDFTTLCGSDVDKVNYIFYNDSLISVNFYSDIFLFMIVMKKMNNQKGLYNRSVVNNNFYLSYWKFKNVTVSIKYPINIKGGSYYFSITSNKLVFTQ